MLSTPDYGVAYAVVFSEANVSCEERFGKKIYYLPLYMAFCLDELVQGDDGWISAPLEEVRFDDF